MQAPAVSALQDLIEQTATNSKLDPAERMALLRGLKADVEDLTGVLDRVMGDVDLGREANAMKFAAKRAVLRENADIRDEMIRRGLASAAQLDAAGMLSHDQLDEAADKGVLAEALFGGVRVDPLKLAALAKKRHRDHGRFADEMSSLANPPKLKGRGGAVENVPHTPAPGLRTPSAPVPTPTPSPAPAKAAERPVESSAPDFEEYNRQAQENLQKTSRTAQGVVDTTASKGKADQVQDVSSDDAKKFATENVAKAMKVGHDIAHETFTPEGAKDAVEAMAKIVNGGILKDGVLIREGTDSAKYPYTRLKDLPAAMDDFYKEFSDRLNDPNADPVETAAFAEYRIDLTDHFFADGCGKTAKAVAAIPLMRAGLPLPQHMSRDEYFKHAPTTIRGQDPEADEKAWQDWLAYYRSVMPGGGPKEPDLHDQTRDPSLRQGLLPEPQPPKSPGTDEEVERIRGIDDVHRALQEVEQYRLNDWPTKGDLAQSLLGEAADTQQLHTIKTPASPGTKDAPPSTTYKASRRPVHDRIVGGVMAPAVSGLLGEDHPIAQKLNAGGRLTEDEKAAVREAASKKRGGKPPQVLFMAGGPASGKSSALRKSPELKPEDAVAINPDDVKGQLPEYREMVEGGEKYAASGVHEESSDISKRLQHEAMDLGLNVVVDGTGDSKPGKFAGKMQEMHDKGYEVKALYVSIPTDVAVVRATLRAMEEGRWVPEKELRAQHRNVSRNFEEVSKLPFLSDLKLYAGRGEGLALTAEGSAGSVDAKDQELYDEFLKKKDEAEG